ncbi:MAG: tRNA (guanine-N(1)-)-methyltransferase [Parcubacteria group bacterium GW2011_GWA2_38_13]|nr:MAG: tRNA (guanine-N(1)-)-methyltransferase [Parcubacteria group bacterium GW2011_GWA2_38_13]
MRFDIITIFPKIFTSYFSETILHRAMEKKFIDVRIHDLRKYAEKNDAHKSVDGRLYGGGPGMILKIEPIAKALRALKIPNSKFQILNSRIIMLTPSGKRYTQRDAERLSKYKRVVLLCGRYEGFDARVDRLVDEKISIGDYVLAGGEIPAMILLETIARHIPGVVGHKDALKNETFSKDLDYKEYPQYTRPEVFYPSHLPSPLLGKEGKFKTPPLTKGRRGGVKKVWRVPKILLSGNHKKIEEWREKESGIRDQ